MDEAIETVGMVATGGLLAREVDRAHAHPVDGSGHDASGACANCGAALTGPFCAACGQHGHVHRTALALVHDILHGVFHFEGRFLSTLPRLAFRPGDLTRRYVHGERAKFVSPMAFFLFSIFLMFTVVANLPGWQLGDSDLWKPGAEQRLATMRGQLAAERAKAEADIAAATARLAKARAETPPDAEAIAAADKRLARATKSRGDLIVAERALAAAPSLPDVKAQPGSTGGAWFEARYRHAKENPKLLLYKIKTSAYKFSWALIPISLPFLWLLFPLRRDVGLYDHAVFATYSLTFMSLLVIVLAVLGALGVGSNQLFLAAAIIPPIHMYRQLKGAYRLSRAGALWRTAWLLFFTAITSTLFVLLLLYLGVAE